MSNRITAKHLHKLVDQLNRQTGHNPNAITLGKWNVGTYVLSSAYGGWELQQISSDGGGVHCPLETGHVPARALYNLIRAYMQGMYDATN